MRVSRIKTKEQIQRFTELYNDGVPYMKIAKIFGYKHERTIRQTAKALGIWKKRVTISNQIDKEEFKKIYPYQTDKVLAKKYGFAHGQSIRNLAKKYGLKKNISHLYDVKIDIHRKVKDEQLDEFIKLYPVTHDSILAKKYGYTHTDSVRRLAKQLGLEKAPDYLDTQQKRAWENLDKLKELYPTTDNKELAKIFGIKLGAIRQKAYYWKLKKDSTFLKNQRRQLALELKAETTVPIGTIHIRNVKSLKGQRKFIKTGQQKWEYYQSHIWKQNHGEIPSGFTVSFKNGDPMDCSIENLELIDTTEKLKRSWTNRAKPQSTYKTLIRDLIFQKNKIIRSARKGRTYKKDFRFSYAEISEFEKIIEKCFNLYGFTLNSKNEIEIEFIIDVMEEIFLSKKSIPVHVREYIRGKISTAVRRVARFVEEEGIEKIFEKFAA